MNKKIFASALFAVAAFVSSIASAQISYDNSKTDAFGAGYVQDGNAKVAPGGSAVRANDIIIKQTGTSTKLIPQDAKIIIRLPKGLNFDGSPSFLVTPATPTLGLTLKDTSEFGDPTLDDPKVELFDANNDGGMDRAVVTAAAAAGHGDSLTISINLTADATATKGAKKASVIVNGGLAATQYVVEVVEGLTEPVFSASGKSLTSIDQSQQTASVTSALFTVTVPKGTANKAKLTFTPQSKVKFSPQGTTITYTVNTPLTMYPFTAVSSTGTFAAGTGTPSLSLTVSGTTTADVQVTFKVSQVQSEAGGSTGTRGLALSGAVSGTAALVNVKANGSSAALTKGTIAAPNKIKEIVAGSSVTQTLPKIDITENFDGDAVGYVAAGKTGTITLTPGTGLKFKGTNTIKVTGTGWTLEAPSASISSTTGKLTLYIANATNTASVGSLTVTISGIGATADKNATGDLSLTVGSPGSPDKSTAPSNKLVVAKATPLGTVDVAGPKTKDIKTTGPGGAAVTSTITFKETTYGALTTSNKTDVQDAYFRLTPTKEGSIKAVTISFSGYPSGAATPTISACSAENNVTTGAWICKITAESSGVTAGTSTISVKVNYSAGSKFPVGTTLAMTIDGNSGVSGTVDVANVGIATSAKAGAITDVKPGATEAKDFAKVTITPKYTNAIVQSREFRLLAPQGVAFQNASATATASPGIATATITATFNPNDTLVMTTKTTATVVFTPKGVLSSGNTGFQSFTLVDGNIDGSRKSGITGESIILAYGDGTLKALDAGANGSVNVGFPVKNTVTGGLNITDYVYTVKSSDATIGSPTISGDVVTVLGKKTGNATITVTDGLGATDTYVVTVSDAIAQPDAEKAAKTADGSTTTATFKAGASSDGGATYATEFTTADDVTLVGTVNVDAADQGKDGEVYIAILSKLDNGSSILAYMDETGSPQTWDGTVAGLGANVVATPLADTYNLTIFSGTLGAGTHRVALAYSTEDGDIVYSGKAMVITVTE